EADPLRAMRRYESIARTFDGLADVAAFRSQAEELRRSKEVSRALDEERSAIAFENSYRDRLPRVYNDFLQRDDALPAAAFAQSLGLSQLQKVAKETSYRGTAAQRVLQAIYGQVAFYLPQQVQGPKLLTLKSVASIIRPPH
ncbi:MAG: hypothetical protein ACXVH7_08360, partial [Thermoanaerobaculia bacterium]